MKHVSVSPLLSLVSIDLCCGGFICRLRSCVGPDPHLHPAMVVIALALDLLAAGMPAVAALLGLGGPALIGKRPVNPS